MYNLTEQKRSLSVRIKIMLVSILSFIVTTACTLSRTRPTPEVTCYTAVAPTEPPTPEVLCYEMSRALEYKTRSVQTPLGATTMSVPVTPLVLCSVLRAGLPLHQGLLNYFDRAENAFISAYRHHPGGGDGRAGVGRDLRRNKLVVSPGPQGGDRAGQPEARNTYFESRAYPFRLAKSFMNSPSTSQPLRGNAL